MSARFEARDGTTLLMRAWPTDSQPRGVLVIMHDLMDNSARYDALARRLVASGYSVYAFDLRGHGRSAGPRAAPRDWSSYVDDLDRFLTMVELREPGRPVFLFGHGMGGTIAALTAERHGPQLAGLILSAPALAIDAPPLLIAWTRLDRSNAPTPWLGKHRDVSSDPATVAAIQHDEWIWKSPPPARTAAGLFEGMRAVWDGIDHLAMPVISMHGTADKITAPAGSRMLIETAPAHDKTLRLYDGFFHDLLHEPNGRQVEDDIVAWLDAHTGGAPVPPPPPHPGKLAGDPRGRTHVAAQGLGVGRNGGRTALALDVTGRTAYSAPFGWSTSFTFRGLATRAPQPSSLALRPVGVALRIGAAAAGLTIGGSWIGFRRLGISSELYFEQPLGPLHLGLTAEHTVRLTGSPRNEGPLASELLWLGATVRFGSDRRYWPAARVGVGPSITAGLNWIGDSRGWFALAGIQFYGVD